MDSGFFRLCTDGIDAVFLCYRVGQQLSSDQVELFGSQLRIQIINITD